jgi:hypothetical protein
MAVSVPAPARVSAGSACTATWLGFLGTPASSSAASRRRAPVPASRVAGYFFER